MNDRRMSLQHKKKHAMSRLHNIFNDNPLKKKKSNKKKEELKKIIFSEGKTTNSS